MYTTKTFLLCGLLICVSAQAGTYEWSSGWGMGVSEHLAAFCKVVVATAVFFMPPFLVSVAPSLG